MQTPWGPSQIDEDITTGIIRVHTAGHGGIYLAPENNRSVHKAWRKADGFYEEDEEWSIVALTFPRHFTAEQVNRAHQLSKTYRGDEYEVVFKGKLTAPAPAGAEGNEGSHKVTESTTVALHRPEPLDIQRWARVSLDDYLGTYDGLLTAGLLWNGFECPAFPRDQVEAMKEIFAKLAAAETPESVDTLRWATDDPNVLEVVSSQYNAAGDELREGDEPDVERLEPDAQGLYHVGGWKWCWGVVEHELILTPSNNAPQISRGWCSCGQWHSTGAYGPDAVREDYGREHLNVLFPLPVAA